MCLNAYPMKYVSPIFGKTMVTSVPCGKCVECVKDRQNSWKIRLSYEMSRWPNVWFFTLTYGDSTLPINIDEESGFIGSTARKKDVQDWLKRMRMRYLREHGEKINMKYFICAEYGPEGEYIDYAGRPRQSTCRPHYHGILMTDAERADVLPFFREWSANYGIVDYSQVEHTSRESRSKSSNYVSKYCCKGEFSSRVYDIMDGLIEPAWSLMSKGIGLDFVEEYRSQFVPYQFTQEGHYTDDEMLNLYFKTQDSEVWDKIKHMVEESFIDDGGHKYKMPKYYKDRLYGVPYYSNRIVPARGYNMSICCDVQEVRHFVENPANLPPITRKTRVVKVRRYVHSNFVSCAMRIYVLVQSAIADWQAYTAERSRDARLSYSEFLHKKMLDKEITAELRESHIRAKLHNFYFSNAEKYRPLNYA